MCCRVFEAFLATGACLASAGSYSFCSEAAWPSNPPSSRRTCKSPTSTTATTPITRSRWRATPARPTSA
ncbi:MAG: hypothetical protein QE485_08780 [Acidovorax sp.]|uniref:DUF1010 domain-containing protein n=2 Tax=unclassified Acidovorax TaxID=2684926 RepID=UPI0026087632|nr:DUF1010 domain-containing protein [Acidovorax sp.]MDH4417306.1 hypothetical protein [Acidovorax sp.]